jgi:hypothetical protein
MKTVEQEYRLKHGQFKVLIKTLNNNTISHIINPLTQEELSDDWQLVVPCQTKKTTIHHFSVYLSYLPSYLWKYLNKSLIDNKQYKTINYGIYKYSIKISKYDNDIIKLYNLIIKQYSNKNQIKLLYNYLKNKQVNGWVMMRAMKLCI